MSDTQSNTFIKSLDLGVIESRFREAITEKNRRKRQVFINRCARLVKDLGLIPNDAQVEGFGQGVNRLGDQGWWITCSNYRFISAGEGAMPKAPAPPASAEELQGRFSAHELDRLPGVPSTAPGKPFSQPDNKE